MSTPAPATQALARSIASGARSAREVLEATLQTIAASNPQVNAFTGQTAERARREADAVDALRLSGAVLPALAGVPYAVKNLFDVQAEVTLAGSKLNRSHAAAAQPPGHTQQRLKQAPQPHQRQNLPPSVEQSTFQLPPTNKPRYDLMPKNSARLQAMAATGQAWPLIQGDGLLFGEYLIISIQTTGTLHFQDGAPRKIEFQITLKRTDSTLLGDLTEKLASLL